jgi:hypothetical protein
MSVDALAEARRSELVKMAEGLAESALSGALDRAIVVFPSPDGKIQVSWVGMTLAEVVGSLQIGLNVVVSKALAR